MSTMAVRIQAQGRVAERPVHPISQRLLIGLGLLEWIVLFAPLCGGVVLLRDGLRLLPVRSMVITGTLHHVRPEEVRAMVTPFAAQGLLVMSIEQVAHVLAKHPWIEHVAVARLWPNRLQIAIEERQATARWGPFLLDEQGRPFQAPSPPQDLPRLSGPKASKSLIFQHFQALARQCLTFGLHLEALQLEPAAWRARVSGVEVLLGTQAPLADMTTYLQVVHPLVRAQQELVERIDLRYRGAFAVRLKGTAPQHGTMAQGASRAPYAGANGAAWQVRDGERLFPLAAGGMYGQET